MEKFYESQPAELPMTLPAGTRMADEYVCVATSTCTLRGSVYHDGLAYWADWECFGGSADGYVLPRDIDWTSVPITPPIEDRPIQAGDWVECVDTDGAVYLRLGARYLVATASYALVIEADDGDQYAYGRERFKRVDGPHPVETDWCDHCGESAGCAENCVTRADEPKLDPYTAHRLKEPACFTSMADLEARARNEAALRREAERPRLTADARELAKPHPWEEFE